MITNRDTSRLSEEELNKLEELGNKLFGSKWWGPVEELIEMQKFIEEKSKEFLYNLILENDKEQLEIVNTPPQSFSGKEYTGKTINIASKKGLPASTPSDFRSNTAVSSFSPTTNPP